jgi:Zn finger protein HypA/HybF involved in hydrogenase expression
MYEIGIALQIVNIIAASVPSNTGKARVEKVNLRIGRLAAVVPEYIERILHAKKRINRGHVTSFQKLEVNSETLQEYLVC